MDLSYIVCIVLLQEFLSEFVGSIQPQATVVRVGIILEDRSEREEEIIKFATEQINGKDDILPNVKLETIVRGIPNNQPFTAVQTVCSLAGSNVSALVSSTGCEANKVIQSVCDDLNIPHVTVPRETCKIERRDGFSLSIRPNYIHLDSVVLDIINRLNWRELIIFYDNETAYKDVQGLLNSATAKGLIFEVVLLKARRDKISQDFNVKRTLEIAKESKIRNYVVYCDKVNSFLLLQQASVLGMTQRDHHWIISTQAVSPSIGESAKGQESNISLDKDISDEELKKFNKTTGIIAIVRQQVLVNFSSDSVREAWMKFYPHSIPQNYTYLGLEGKNVDNITSVTVLSMNDQPAEDNQLNIESAYIYDAIRVTATAINASMSSGTWSDPAGVACFNSEISKPWPFGHNVKTSLYKIDLQGMMGRINFNGTCYNDQVTMEILSLESRFDSTLTWRIGSWDPIQKLTLVQMPFRRGLGIRNFTIVTIVEAPFVMREETVKGIKYSGYCIDMLIDIASALGFNYTLYEVPDGKYGGENPDGTWNGLVGQVYHGFADLAVAGMIINSDREKVVDFTKPYMNYGVGILIRKPSKRKNMFAFLEPLNIWVWSCILAAFFIVGVLLYVLDRLSPYSNHNLKREGFSHCADDFDLKNSLWFAFASFMQQGGDTTPISFSGRILSAFWWFFALIVIATYTANLAAFLTVTRMENPINSLEDLAYQSKVAYGTIEDSSLQRFFEKRSHVGVYEKMWNTMNHADPPPWVKTDKEGYQRVKEQNYAFLWDAPILEYLKQTECELMTVGKPFNLKGYGIATPQGADYRDQISLHILRMQEEGKLEELRKKWFERESICTDDEPSSTRDTSDIGLETVAGVFYILIMGAAMSFLTVIVEHMWHRPSVYKKKCKSIKTKSKVNFHLVPPYKTTRV
ncbi:glutamate receptor ionotropic, delta-2-like isoform X2 [Ptychodera flava]|uniref:glutamate receptor ionotropic, delta-2-like isoform X2 n=1 Tax=Ptychodera flava TaxID=63121 RepID=UPI00396A085D